VKKEEATTDDTDPSLPITEILNQEKRKLGKGAQDFLRMLKLAWLPL